MNRRRRPATNLLQTRICNKVIVDIGPKHNYRRYGATIFFCRYTCIKVIVDTGLNQVSRRYGPTTNVPQTRTYKTLSQNRPTKNLEDTDLQQIYHIHRSTIIFSQMQTYNSFIIDTDLHSTRDIGVLYRGNQGFGCPLVDEVAGQPRMRNVVEKHVERETTVAADGYLVAKEERRGKSCI